MLNIEFDKSPIYQNLALVNRIEDDNYTVGIASCYGCRELFHAQFRRGQHDVVFHTYALPQTLAFFKTVEDRLKLDPKSRLQLILTNQYGWYEVKSTWWFRQNVRFSLLTILLRASLIYDNIDNAIESIPHLSITSDAVKEFLSGKTKYKGTRISGKIGWVAVFRNYIPHRRPYRGKLTR